MNTELRVVIFQEGDAWVAQCVDYDIGAQAATLELLYRRLQAVVRAEREHSTATHGEAFKGIPPSPARFEQMWDRAVGEFTPQSPRARSDSERIGYRIANAA